MSLAFHESVLGRVFIEGTMPRVADALERIATALEEANGRSKRYSEGDTAKEEDEKAGSKRGGKLNSPTY